VTESVPTTHTGIGGAVLTIADTDLTTVTNAIGFYSIPGVPSAEITINVSADGYVATSRHLTANGNTTSDFELRPVPAMLSHTSTGSIGGNDGTCNDGVAMKPCRLLVFPVHNPGPIEVTLSWESTSAVDLDLSVFQTGATTPIARSAVTDPAQEQVTANVTVGGTYEVRVTYSSGSDNAAYTLKLTYPN
jgi:hypothetical protein